MKRETIVVVLALSLMAVPVAAQTAITYDFESGTLDSDFSNEGSSDFAINSTNALEGTYDVYCARPSSCNLELDPGIPDEVESVTSLIRWNGNGQYQFPKMSLRRASDNAQFAYLYHDSGTGNWTVLNSTSDDVDLGIEANSDTIYTIGIEPYYNGSARYFVEGPNKTVNRVVTNFQSASSTGVILWTSGNDNGVSVDLIKVNQGLAPAPDTTSTSLELDINTWMPRDDSQPYRVYLNETNTTTGNSNITEVTADANVTIYNITNTSSFSEPIATVNNTTDTIKSYNQTGVVAVNASYQGTELTNATNLTVGPRNLSNIGIMPPPQWPCSFLGCDEAPGGGDNPHNIGSSMQWLWLIIVIMVAATKFSENPWVGVGTGMVFSILVWVLEYIDLGAVLVTVFSGLLIGALMARTQMGRGVTRDNEQSGIDATQVRNRK